MHTETETLLSTESLTEANLVASILVAQSIEARVVHPDGLNVPGQHCVVVTRDDAEAARQAIARAREEVDWDAESLGTRSDDLPLKPPGRMPLAAKIGWVVAAVFIVGTIVMAIVSLFV